MTREFAAITTLTDIYRLLHLKKSAEVVIRYLEIFLRTDDSEYFEYLLRKLFRKIYQPDQPSHDYSSFYDWVSETPLEEIKSLFILSQISR